MPVMTLIADVTESGFKVLTGIADLDSDPRVIHVNDEREVEVGVMPGGMQSGADSVAVCMRLNDDTVLIWETSAALWIQAADLMSGLHRSRRPQG